MKGQTMTVEEAKKIHPNDSFRFILRNQSYMKCRVIGHYPDSKTVIVVLLLPEKCVYSGITTAHRHNVPSKYLNARSTLVREAHLTKSYNTFHNNPPNAYQESK